MHWSNAAVAMSAQCLVLPECGPLAEVGSLRIPVHWRDGSYGILDWITASVGLDVGRPHHLAPLLGFVGDQPSKAGGREREYVATYVGKPRPHLGIGKNLIDNLIEHLDGLGGRILRSTDPKKCASLIAWHELTHRWDFRHHFRARCCSHSQHR